MYVYLLAHNKRTCKNRQKDIGNLVLIPLVRRINSSRDIAMYRLWRFGLKLPIHAPLWGIFGAYFPHMTSPIVPIPKRTVVWAIYRKNQWRFDLGTWPRKKDSITKKSQKCYISPIWGEVLVEPIRPKSCMVGDVYDVITCAKFQIEIFIGYDFTGGRIFDFHISNFHCQANY